MEYGVYILSDLLDGDGAAKEGRCAAISSRACRVSEEGGIHIYDWVIDLEAGAIKAVN